MITFSRLLELSGRKLLTEALSPKEATQIFKYHGATAADFSNPTTLKAARKRLMMQNHPDKAGTAGLEAAKEINAAYDILKVSGLKTNQTRDAGAYWYDTTSGKSRPYTDERDADEDTSWDTDSRGSHHISGKNDINYFKKRMWELCGKSRENRYTIWNFDGYFFRGCVTVFGSPKIFPEMAKGMREWDSSCNSRAVFVTHNSSSDLYLIWSDGQDHNPPIPFEHDSFNRNPGNDQRFMRKLPEMLDKIRDK